MDYDDILHEWLTHEEYGASYCPIFPLTERRLIVENDEYLYLQVLDYAKDQYHTDDIYGRIEDFESCYSCDDMHHSDNLRSIGPSLGRGYVDQLLCEDCNEEFRRN